MKDINKIEDSLKYNFKNRQLLESAITHTSILNKKDDYTYERLEFLGDRVLGLSIANLIYKKFLNESEGELARRIAVLVSGKMLAKIAININLQNYIRVSDNFNFSNGQNYSILSDTMEAIIGAIFLDSNYNEVKNVIQLLWKEYILADEMPPKDSKSALQELAMQLKYEMPLYSNYEKEGPDHSPKFTVEVSIKGINKIQGLGQSKKSAEADAANKLLKIIERNSN
ncbi:MAG: ribonuclease III [Pelagibacterales bacterium]|nr:ribonuclease III [Pelagibacterales bacterium]RCL81501.1 MAG: ribonuclease III [Alphaproteobacteria bacterium]|tara:strand:+ start:753 stop:1433 length:681 start_codon:yes stop_codon:yes gene_type:complete